MQIQLRARWRARPLSSAVLRFLTVVIPPGVAFAVAVALGRALPPPTGLARSIGWWTAVTAVSLLSLLALDRVARRLLPLAMLLRMSLAFPDHTPSRLRTALRAWHPKKLRRDAEAIGEAGGIDDPVRAAEIVLALLASLTSHHTTSRIHSERVRGFAEAIAAEMDLPQRDLDILRWAALLHDIGKLGVPAKVLSKQATLTDGEWEIIRTHPDRGANLVRTMLPQLDEASTAIRQHHERMDGTGYPGGLSGTRICPTARIVSVADAFETMVSLRSYGPTRSLAEARQELVDVSGAQFDPEVVRAFMSVAMGRLWRVAGLRAWLSQIPVIGWMLRLGARARAPLSNAPQTAAAGLAVALVGLMSLAPDVPGGGRAEASPPGSVDGRPPILKLISARLGAPWGSLAPTGGSSGRHEADGGGPTSGGGRGSGRGAGQGSGQDPAPTGDAPEGRRGVGLALGREKETGPGEGLALGVEKATGPGEGLRLGSAVEAPGRAVREAKDKSKS